MGSHRFLRVLCAALFSLTLAGCGSDDAFNGDGTGVTPTPTGPTVATLALLASSPQLSSNAQGVANGVTLTAIARDANQNVVSGAQVVFSTTGSALIAAASPAVTNANGQVTATVTTGGDPQNRSVTVTATSGGVSSSVVISVVGTTLDVTGPASAQINTPTQYTAALVDSGGVGISGRAVNISTNAGNALSASSLTTDASGVVTFTMTPTAASSFVTATALGLSDTQNVTVSTDQFVFTAPAEGASVAINQAQTVTVSWLQGSPGTAVPNGTVVNFTTTRGVLSAAQATTVNGVAQVTINSAQAGEASITAASSALTRPTATRTVQFVASTAASVDVQADPAVISTNEASNISAIVRDAANNLVANKLVEFTLVDSSGGTLSSSTATTNNLGIARVIYNASSVTSGADGVRITAVARNTGGSSASDFVTLTVGARALRILLGTGNELLEPNETVYQLPYSAIVTDAAGNPAPDAGFSLSVFALAYAKGFYSEDPLGGDPIQNITVTCANEDLNRNGILDPGEDINGNGRLEPGNVGSVPSAPPLDPVDGTVQFNITYPQDRGRWVRLELTARAAVSGTETTERVSFVLPILEDDAENPPGPESPYGIAASCADPN